jgi:prepilin-type N-terminal cleavage/methylation domain-containing protein
MISLKSKQKGFTIVELLIVIVVIGILVALVVTTFSGIQRRARDTERQTDIKAVHSQLEAYYAQEGHYPVLADITAANLPGLDDEALVDPGGGALASGGGSSSAYGYATVPADCDNAGAGDCTEYTLTATLESGGTFVRNSLN